MRGTPEWMRTCRFMFGGARNFSGESAPPVAYLSTWVVSRSRNSLFRIETGRSGAPAYCPSLFPSLYARPWASSSRYHKPLRDLQFPSYGDVARLLRTQSRSPPLAPTPPPPHNDPKQCRTCGDPEREVKCVGPTHVRPAVSMIGSSPKVPPSLHAIK